MTAEPGGPGPAGGPAPARPERAGEAAGRDEGERRAGVAAGGRRAGPDRGAPAATAFERAQGAVRCACGTAVVGIGATALLGWATGYRALTTGRTGSIPVAPNTGVAFLLLGTGVCLLPHSGASRRGRLIAGSGAALVVLVCALRLAEYATSLDLGVDRLFFRAPGEFFGLAAVGKMAFFTAAALVVSGTATLLLAVRGGPGRLSDLAGTLNSLVAATGSVFGLGYLFDAPYHYRGSTIPMALFTAVGLVLLGSGSALAAGPGALPLRPLLGPSVHARLLRVFLPLIVSAVFLSAWLTHLVTRYVGEAFLAVTSALGLVGTMLATALICAWTARLLGEQLRRGEDALRAAHDALEGQVALRTLELSLANQRLSELATTDGLTGLKNTRYFRDALASAFSFASRRGLPLSVVLLDVDQFKPFNDAFGHPAGDEALRAVSRLLVGNVRDHDVVARYGGEEFAVLLLGADDRVGRRLAERLRAAIQEADWPLRPVTASFGVASITPDIPSASALVEAADRALYNSKRSGRNRITHHDDATVASVVEALPGAPRAGRAP